MTHDFEASAKLIQMQINRDLAKAPAFVVGPIKENMNNLMELVLMMGRELDKFGDVMDNVDYCRWAVEKLGINDKEVTDGK